MANKLYEVLESRILLLDGGFGTMVQQYGFTEEDYRGERFRDWNVLLKGCNDLLAVTRPGAVREIHVKYLQAGADIIETDSFNANAVSLADYGLEAYAYEISRAAAGVARSAADEFTARNPLKPRFVAGSMGPTNRTASMSADVGNPAAREVTFTQLAEAYTEQARGLVDGGADVLLVETVFDTLNAKAALYAIDTLAAQLGRAIPVMISGTLADASGRTLSGQTVEAFYASVSHARLLSVGFNCAYGARQLMPYLERLAAVAEFRISAHPNAGLPNVMGGYDETPEMFARDVGEYMRRGLVNIVGGCCGTTPAHIFELAKIAGYLHDIGNLVNRIEHSQSGAVMAFQILTSLGFGAEDVATIVTAIGNHDEGTGVPVNAVAAALILADKADVRRSRVRNQDTTTFDIHDRVNYSVKKSTLKINEDRTLVKLKLTVDTHFGSVMDYFEIFMQRMILCRKAAEKLGLQFKLIINEQQLI